MSRARRPGAGACSQKLGVDPLAMEGKGRLHGGGLPPGASPAWVRLLGPPSAAVGQVPRSAAASDSTLTAGRVPSGRTRPSFTALRRVSLPAVTPSPGWVSPEGLTGEGSAPCGCWQSSVPQGLLEAGPSSSVGAGWRPPPCLATGLPLASMAACFIRASGGRSLLPRRKSLSFEI